jgi:hypothetical protein
MSRLSAVDIRVEGDEALLEALGKLQGSAADKLLRDALSKGGLGMKPFVRNAAPSGGPGGSRMDQRTHPGDLKKSISVKRGRRSRPPAAIVYPKGTGWYSKWVIGGTQPHRIRFADQRARGMRKEQGNIQHPGVRRLNPYMTRGGKAGTPAALARIEKHIDQYIESLD